MILFETRVAVPKNTVYQIGCSVADQLIKSLIENSEFSANDINLIKHRAEQAALAIANSTEKSCEGWTVDHDQANLIASLLRKERRIEAIKEFRAATGAGLREAKDLIDKFPADNRGAMEFLATFV